MSRFVAHVFAIASWARCCIAGDCNSMDDIEIDLCDNPPNNDESAAYGLAPLSPMLSGGQQLILLSALSLRTYDGGAATTLFMIPFLSLLPSAKAELQVQTCQDLKSAYKTSMCCDKADKSLQPVDEGELKELCAPRPQTCEEAAPQAPRDLSKTGDDWVEPGKLTPKSPTLTVEQVEDLKLVNVHFHLGAEHKTDDFNQTYVKNDIEPNVTAGYACTSRATNPPVYIFQHCQNVTVGGTYEVHYVHSSAGYNKTHLEHASTEDIDDGLGGAASGRGIRNPTIAVEAMTMFIVEDDQEGFNESIMFGWSTMPNRSAISYMGSTTGESHNNKICSPYVVTWHVDLTCHNVKASAFDEMCRQMKENFTMTEDLKPHGSREIVSGDFVVKSEYIKQLDMNDTNSSAS